MAALPIDPKSKATSSTRPRRVNALYCVGKYSSCGQTNHGVAKRNSDRRVSQPRSVYMDQPFEVFFASSRFVNLLLKASSTCQDFKTHCRNRSPEQGWGCSFQQNAEIIFSSKDVAEALFFSHSLSLELLHTQKNQIANAKCGKQNEPFDCYLCLICASLLCRPS